MSHGSDKAIKHEYFTLHTTAERSSEEYVRVNMLAFREMLDNPAIRRRFYEVLDGPVIYDRFHKIFAQLATQRIRQTET